MYEYLVMIGCFLAMILLFGFLLNVAFKKMNSNYKNFFNSKEDIVARVISNKDLR